MVDVVRWLLDDEPDRVYAVSRDGILNSRGVDAPDVTVATVEFRRGAVAVFEHAWILPRTQSVVKDLKLEVLGRRGALYVDGSHHRTLEVYSAEKAAWPDVLAPPTGAHLTGFVLDSIAYFVDAVVRDAPVLATGQDGIAVTRLICAILQSIQTRLPVEL
jgi:predicted dehydrogenase